MHTIVITGAGSGLGKELALIYAQKGNSIILVGRSLYKLKQLEEEIQQLGAKAWSYTLDIRQYEEVKKFADVIIPRHQPDFLLNNAGVGYFGELESLTKDHINEMIDTNVKGTIFLTQAFLSYLKQLPSAKIMNIISTAGLRGKVNESVYVASKFAIRGFSESLVKELESTNICVTAVYMGGMDTPFWEGTNHIQDRSRLRSPKDVAAYIVEQDDGRSEIIVE
jgi:uncharacterized protein